MNRRVIITASLGFVLATAGVVGGVLYFNRSTTTSSQTAVINRAEQLNAAQIATVRNSPYEKLLFLSQGNPTNQLFIGSVADSNIARLSDTIPLYYSNFLPQQQFWLGADGTTLSQHTLDSTTVIATLSQAAAAPLAVDPTANVVSWVTRDETGLENIHLLQLADKTDSIIYTGIAGENYSNLTWSPDGSELAFVINNGRIITVNQAGAQLYNSISLPFTQFSSLQWIESNHLAVVASSLDSNPQPFSPRLLVLDRLGTVIETHDVFKKIGVPKVLWSPDGTRFMFRDPWSNHFLIYDRFDHLKNTLTFKTPGKLTGFGWMTGQTLPDDTVSPITTTNTTTNTTPTPTNQGFTVSDTDWDRYNTIVRNVLEQFPVDFSTYRFATTDKGLQIAITTQPTATQPELVAVQSIMQLFAILPNIPAISFTLTVAQPDQSTVIQIPYTTEQQAKDIVASFTAISLDELFVVTATHPIGDKTAKADNPKHNYVGDLVYSQFGEYNPFAILAALQAKVDEKVFYHTDAYNLLYPSTWSVKAIDDTTTVWSTGETHFVSPTAWSGFAFTVKTYSAPAVTLDQWLSVNRSDQTTEPVTFTVAKPLDMRHIITTTNRDEYDILVNNKVYALILEHDSGVTESDKVQLQHIAQSFTDTYAFQR